MLNKLSHSSGVGRAGQEGQDLLWRPINVLIFNLSPRLPLPISPSPAAATMVGRRGENFDF